jgi:predicted nucleotidyltransferase
MHGSSMTIGWRPKHWKEFCGKPVQRVELFGFAARGGMTSQSDLDILVTRSPAATLYVS